MRHARESIGKMQRERTLRGGGRPKRRRGASEQLSDLTKTELYERARELDIPGRSSMGRDELYEALQRAGAQGTRKSSP